MYNSTPNKKNRSLSTWLEKYQRQLTRQLSDTYPTGLAPLDRHQGGGLHPRVYLLISDSSSVMTALMLQLAAGLTRDTRLPDKTIQHADVLYFSTKTMTDDLLCSLMCHAINAPDAQHGLRKPAYTAFDLIQSTCPSADHTLWHTGCAWLTATGSTTRLHIFAHEDNFHHQIKHQITSYLNQPSSSRLCIIAAELLDLTANPGTDRHAAQNQNCVKTLRYLARISRRYWTPILVTAVVSSKLYHTYDYRPADVILRLQPDYNPPSPPHGDSHTIQLNHRSARPERVTLNCLKDHYGWIKPATDARQSCRRHIPLHYYPEHGWFMPCNEPAD